MTCDCGASNPKWSILFKQWLCSFCWKAAVKAMTKANQEGMGEV